jgi:hypothetical protein
MQAQNRKAELGIAAAGGWTSAAVVAIESL